MPVSIRFVGSGDSFGSGGRFQTCILVDGGGMRFTIDFGTSSLIALKQQGIDHNSIDAVLLTHLHGDHCGGVPFLLVDAMLGAKRSRPLTIAGPRDLRSRMGAIAGALFPGSEVMVPKFPLDYVEMEVGERTVIGNLRVTPYAAKHTWQTNPTCLRVEVGDKVIASFTWDTGEAGGSPSWTLVYTFRDGRILRIEWHYGTLTRPWPSSSEAADGSRGRCRSAREEAGQRTDQAASRPASPGRGRQF